MPAYASEAWRRFEAVQAEITEIRPKRNRARALAASWAAIDRQRGEHWLAQARTLAAEMRELLRLRSELAMKIAIERAPALTTKGTHRKVSMR